MLIGLLNAVFREAKVTLNSEGAPFFSGLELDALVGS